MLNLHIRWHYGLLVDWCVFLEDKVDMPWRRRRAGSCQPDSQHTCCQYCKYQVDTRLEPPQQHFTDNSARLHPWSKFEVQVAFKYETASSDFQLVYHYNDYRLSVANWLR